MKYIITISEKGKTILPKERIEKYNPKSITIKENEDGSITLTPIRE